MPFIVFEGLDGSGKSTLMNQLEETLKKMNKKILRTREPGGTVLGDEIRHLILRTIGHAPTPRTELLLYEASRAQHVDEVLKPALAAKSWILCDRFTASSIAFQAGGRILPQADVEWLNCFATAGVEPDLTVLLDLPVEVSVERRQKREKDSQVKADRIEKEKLEFHQSVRQSFLNQAQKTPEKWLVLNAEKQSEILLEELLREIERRGWASFSL